MATANTKLTVDTSQAQGAIKGLSTAWINASAKLNVVQGALNYVGNAMEFVNQKIREQAQFFSATKDAMGLAAVQMSSAATDGMIKPMTLAKGANVLMRGDLKLTQDQMNSVAKAAVELGRATGEDVNNVFDRLSKGVLKGSTEAVSEYGITVANTGPIQQRQAAILAELEKRYSGVAVSASDAAEVQDKYANQAQLQTMQAVKNLDGMAKAYSFLKAEAVEGFAEIGELFTDAPLTKASQAAAQYQALAEQSLENQREVNRLSLALLDPEINKTKNAAKRLELQKQYASRLSTQGQIENAIIGYASKYNFTLNDIFARKERIERSSKSQAEVEKIITKENEKQNKILGEIAQKKAEDDVKVNALLSIAAEDDARDKARREAAKSAAETAAAQLLAIREANNQKLLDMERKRDEEWTRIEREGYEERLKIQEGNYDRRIDAYTRENDKLQAIADKAKQKEKEAKKREDDKAFDAKMKAWEDAVADAQKKIDLVRSSVQEMSSITINAMMAEAKARDGLSKSDYVLKQLSTYMKGKAIQYGAETLAHLAEAAAASYLNPEAVPKALAAAAFSAKAALAFGGGAAITGAMAGSGGKASSSKGSSSSSKGPQRETLTGTSVQRSEITVILGGRGVVIGNADELARQIGTIMGDAQRRGVVRA